jgi:hypothetical protein
LIHHWNGSEKDDRLSLANFKKGLAPYADININRSYG